MRRVVVLCASFLFIIVAPNLAHLTAGKRIDERNLL